MSETRERRLHPALERLHLAWDLLVIALVVSRRGDLPRQGFFDLAVALGRFPADPAEHEAAYRQELGRVMASRG